MRLLHAGLRHGAVHALPSRHRAQTGSRSSIKWPAISAAAPAIGRSSMRRSQSCNGSASDRWAKGAQGNRSATCRASMTAATSSSAMNESFFAAPASEAALAELTAKHPDATFVAGATDVGLWITKQLRTLPQDHLSRAGRRIARHDAKRIDCCRSALPSPMPKRRAASAAHRSRSRRTAAPPRLQAGARLRHDRRQYRQWFADRRHAAGVDRARRELELRHGQNRREMPLEDFFIAYGKQDRAAGEIVWRIDIPKLGRERAFPLLQDRQALRPGYFGRDGCLQVHARRAAGSRRRALPSAAWRQRRSARRKAEAALAGASLDDAASWQPALQALA